MRRVVQFIFLLWVSSALSVPAHGFQVTAHWEFSLTAVLRGRHGALLILNGTGWLDPGRLEAFGSGTALLHTPRGTLTHGDWSLLGVLQVVPHQASGPRPVQRVDMLVLIPAVQPAPLILEARVRRPATLGGPSLFAIGHLGFNNGHGTILLRPTSPSPNH